MNAGDTRMQQFGALVQAIVSGEVEAAKKMLRASPQLAKERAVYGATRQTAGENFYKEILHYIHEGDTALRMAAAAYQEQIVTELIARGADVRAKNRRGTEPIHYAADGVPDSPAIQMRKQRLSGASSRQVQTLTSWTRAVSRRCTVPSAPVALPP
jgi:hypothetical protein